MDNITVACKRLAYAKICVEIDVDKKIPSSVNLVMRDEIISLISMDVSWFPTNCTTCNVFGHSVKTCPKVEREVWQVKKYLPPKVNKN